MNTPRINGTCAIALFLCLVYWEPSSAAALTSIPPPLSGQCGATSINNSGNTVGVCIPANQQSSGIAWHAAFGMAATVLQPLVANQSCLADGITNSDIVIGKCVDGDGRQQGVIWKSPGGNPTPLLPLSTPLNLGSHVQSLPMAFNQAGFIAGQSLTSKSLLIQAGESSAVVWTTENPTPERIFNGLLSGNDDCSVVGLSEAGNGIIAIPMNCPATGAIAQPEVAVRGSTGGYTVTPLPIDSNAEVCTVSAINASQQMVGSCRYMSTPDTKMAYWSPNGTNSWSITVVTQQGPAGAMRNGGVDININGHILMKYQRLQGTTGYAFYDPVSNTAKYVQELTPNTGYRSAALTDNDLIIVRGENASGNIQSAIFNPASGTPGGLSAPTPLSPLSANTNSGLTGVSNNGQWAAGIAEDSSHNRLPVLSAIP